MTEDQRQAWRQALAAKAKAGRTRKALFVPRVA